ncbi:MAG TPA: hypothetical protein VGG64_24085 [Pirellulales bacterium]|jgi:hypothetical protein
MPCTGKLSRRYRTEKWADNQLYLPIASEITPLARPASFFDRLGGKIDAHLNPGSAFWQVGVK